MIEKYYKYKYDYKDYVLFIKNGIFYDCLDNDALIINKLFNYKIKIFNNFMRVGFPIKNIDSVINKLKDNNINYVIIDKDIEYKYECNNKYYDYFFDKETIMYKQILIDEICNYLDDNRLDIRIDLLEQVKKLLFK